MVNIGQASDIQHWSRRANGRILLPPPPQQLSYNLYITYYIKHYSYDNKMRDEGPTNRGLLVVICTIVSILILDTIFMFSKLANQIDRYF